MDVLDSQESSRGDPGCKSSYVDNEPVFQIYEVRCVTIFHNCCCIPALCQKDITLIFGDLK